MNWFAVRAVFLLFLGSIALVRRAQNEFYENDIQNPLRGLFPFEGGSVANLKDTFDDGNIQKVIGILQNNIKQWSFIESQLLEPNVNLGMPEIFIPLKHLTTTLEILGNIFFVRDELTEAKNSLERACPLMELLPASLLSDEDFSAAANEVLGADGMRLDPAEFSSFFWMANTNSHAHSQQAHSQQAASAGIHAGNADGTGATNYAAGCFALLRDVYARLYGASPQAERTNTETDTGFGRVRNTASVAGLHEHRQAIEPALWHSSHNSVPSSFTLPNGKPRELNLKYVLSGRQQRQQMKTRKLVRGGGGMEDGHGASVGNRLLGLGSGGARSTKVSNAKLSMSGASVTVRDAYLEKSAAALLLGNQPSSSQQQPDDSSPDASDEEGQPAASEVGHRRRSHKLLLDSDSLLYGSRSSGESPVSTGKQQPAKQQQPSSKRTSVFSDTAEEDAETAGDTAGGDTSHTDSSLKAPQASSSLPTSAGTTGSTTATTSSKQQQAAAVGFDVEQQLADLRSPFEHLRSELQLVQDKQHKGTTSSGSGGGGNGKDKNDNNNNKKSKTSKKKASAGDTADGDGGDDDTDGGGDVGVSQAGPGRGAGLGLRNTASAAASSAGVAGDSEQANDFVRGFDGSALNIVLGQEITSPGVSTSLIAEDLEVLLRRFVRADRRGRRGLLSLARKYYDELDINFPNMDYNEYAANMDVGQAYLEVMGRVNTEGFAFIASELRSWRDIAEQQRAHASSKKGKGSGKGAAGEKAGKAGGGSAGKEAGSNGRSSKGASKDPAGAGAGATAGTAALAPVQLTMAERNRLLVLYAFDILRANPQDTFDLALGFNRGIVDNDRSRRGEHFMSDTLYRDALYSHILSGGSDGQISSSGGGSSAFSPSSAGANPTCGAGSCARAGVVDALLDAELHLLDAFAGLSAVDDAHKRLFPFDSAGLSDTQHLTEQHLRQLLHQAGDEYLAAKSARASKRAGAGISSGGDGSSGGGGSSKEKARNRRRRQRADADPTDTGGDSAFDSAGAAGVGAGGEGTAGIRQSEGFFSSSSYSQDPEGVADFYDDGATLRSSVPSLTGSEADWTLSIFLLFMLLTGAVVYSAYQEAARKRLTGRNRLRQISGGYGSAGKKQSISFFSGTGFVDFLYAMMGSTGGGGGAGEWDDTKDSVADASTEKAATGAVGVSSASAGHSGGGASKKRGGAKDTSASSSHADTAATSSAPGVRKTTLLGDFLALLASNTGSTGSMSTGAADSKTGDLFTAVASSVPSAAKVANGSSNGTGHGNGKSMALATATDGSAVTASVSAGTNGGGGAKGVHKHPDANPAQSSAGGKGKNKKGVHPTKAVVQPAPVVPVPAAAASTSNGKKIVSSDSHTSLTSIASTSSDGDSTTAAAAHSAEVFVPPVTLNNRRVSYAGLIDPALLSGGGDGAAGEDSDWQGAGQGDWAEARKKGSKKHSAGAAGGADDTAGGAARPDRISLALKDSPLYRHAPARAPPPAPAAPTAPAPTVSARPGASVAAGEGAWGNGKRPAGTVNSAPSTAGNSSQLQSGVQGQQGQQGGSVSTTSVPQQYGGVASVGGGAGGSGRLGLSEAMKLAELGNLSFNPSPSASAGQAAGPPGLPRSALPSPSVALQSPSAQQPPQKQQFGFSRFDILASSAAANASSASALAAAAAAEASNSRASTQTSTTTTTASVNGGSGSSLSPMGASLFAANRNGNGGVYGGASAAGAGANGLYDLVGYLDNANGSSRTGTAAGAAATATYTSGTASTSTAASLGTTYYNGTLYGDYSSSTNGLYPSGGQATDDVSGSDAYDMLDDHYYDAYSAGGNSTYLQQYGGSGGSTAAASNYQGQQQQLDYNASQSSHFGFYTSTAHAANAGRSSWADAPRYSSGGNSVGSGGYDLAPSITLEASAVYGLSPDAPSFRPSSSATTLRSTGSGIGSAGSGMGAGLVGGAGFGLSAGLGMDLGVQPVSGSRLFGGHYGSSSGGGGTGGMSSIDGAAAASATAYGASYAPVSTSQQHQQPYQQQQQQQMFNPEEFYESILIDSILGGDDQDLGDLDLGLELRASDSVYQEGSTKD